jgi:hypothetical protein
MAVRLHDSGPGRSGSPDHASATAVNQKATGAGVSTQAFALRRKLLEVDTWGRQAGITVVEVHPEVSFATLAGRPLPESKRTWAGAIRRRRLLDEAGIVLDDDLGPAGSTATVDDILDAAIASRPPAASPAPKRRRCPTYRKSSPTASPAPSGPDHEAPSPPERRAAMDRLCLRTTRGV